MEGVSGEADCPKLWRNRNRNRISFGTLNGLGLNNKPVRQIEVRDTMLAVEFVRQIIMVLRVGCKSWNCPHEVVYVPTKRPNETNGMRARKQWSI